LSPWGISGVLGMWLNNFAQSLAQGPFLIFALIIGVIVSIDVFVVEFTRKYEPEESEGKRLLWTSRMYTMAMWHAMFHSFSFFLYILIIYGVQSLAFWPLIEFDVPEGVGFGLLTLINYVVVSFVWWTYRSKIKEDHSNKSDDSDAVERRDMRLLVDLVRAISHRFNLGEKARGVAVAGSVAVDMLAISALLKLYLIPNNSHEPISSLFGILFIDIAIFASVIFCVVFVLVLAAQGIGLLMRESIRLIVFLRFLEPFAVFFIMAGALRSLMQIGLGWTSDRTNGFGMIYDSVFAGLMVASLVISTGISWDELRETYKRLSFDKESRNPVVTFEDVLHDVKGMRSVGWISLILLTIVTGSMLIAYSTSPGRETHNHLIEATGYIAELAVFGTIVFLYLPSKKVDRIEMGMDVDIRQVHDFGPREFWSTLLGVAMALAVFNGFNWFVFGNTFEVNAMLMWSFYLMLSWLFFDLRRWRFFISGGGVLGAGRTNDAAYAELVAAIGLASSVVAIIATRLVAQLIA